VTEDLILVGRIGRTHGIRGDVFVNPETDAPEDRFVPGRVLHLEAPGRSERVTIASVKFHQGRPIVGFEGIDTMEAAEILAGAELRIPEAELPPLRRFILPGGVQGGSLLHLARTVCRRAERRIVGLASPADPIVVVYLNRLSDLLFVMARAANHRSGVPETEW